MKKIEQFQITSMTIAGFKSYQDPTELTYVKRSLIPCLSRSGPTSLGDAFAYAINGRR